MRLSFFAAVLLCGCGSSDDGGSRPNTRPDGPPAVDAGPLIDAALDAPVVEDDDPDRDGILTPVDNCPLVANPLQANDDGDPRGDACDPCPWKANEASEDLDDDHLTDICDPDPRYADELIYFEGFDKVPTDQALPTGWTALTSTGTWTLSAQDGTLRGEHSMLAGDAPALLARDLGAEAFSDRIYVRASALLVDGGANERQAGITADLEMASISAPAGAFCDLTLDTGKSVAGYFRDRDTSEEGNTVGNRNNPVSLSLTVERGDAHKVRCDAIGAVVSSAAMDDDPTPRTGTGIGLRVSNGSATYRFVAVYRLNTLSKPPSEH